MTAGFHEMTECIRQFSASTHRIYIDYCKFHRFFFSNLHRNQLTANTNVTVEGGRVTINCCVTNTNEDLSASNRQASSVHRIQVELPASRCIDVIYSTYKVDAVRLFCVESILSRSYSHCDCIGRIRMKHFDRR